MLRKPNLSFNHIITRTSIQLFLASHQEYITASLDIIKNKQTTVLAKRNIVTIPLRKLFTACKKQLAVCLITILIIFICLACLFYLALYISQLKMRSLLSTAKEKTLIFWQFSPSSAIKPMIAIRKVICDKIISLFSQGTQVTQR